jgi:D-alanine transfer protein
MDTARAGVTSLNIAQSLATIGPDLSGKKIVISFTPSMFESPGVGVLAYSDNFSPLHAEELVFSPTLSIKLKQLIADRMLAYPTTLEQAPLLRFELGNLAHGSPLFLAMYYAAWPLGELETTALQLQDHAAVLDYLGLHKNLPLPVRRASSIGWAQEVKAAQVEQISVSANNPYGVDAEHWPYYEKMFDRDPRPGSLDWKFINALHDSAEWTDFDLMLQVLKELGAKPLILSRPFNGPLLNEMGISTQALNLYYDKLEAAVAPYQFTLVDFRQYTQDPYFSSDQSSHTSRKGWVYVDQTLDSFYHDRMP